MSKLHYVVVTEDATHYYDEAWRPILRSSVPVRCQDAMLDPGVYKWAKTNGEPRLRPDPNGEFIICGRDSGLLFVDGVHWAACRKLRDRVHDDANWGPLGNNGLPYSPGWAHTTANDLRNTELDNVPIGTRFTVEETDHVWEQLA